MGVEWSSGPRRDRNGRWKPSHFSDQTRDELRFLAVMLVVGCAGAAVMLVVLWMQP